MDIGNDGKIQIWFENAGLSENTQKGYLVFMRLFCKCVGKSPTELVSEGIAEMKAGKLPAERNIAEYVAKFKRCLREDGFAPKSEASAMACIKSFYKAFDIPLPSVLGKIKKPLPQKENMHFLKKEDVQKLLTNAKNLRDRAIILLMATSGLARNEIIHLRIRDISYDENGIAVIDVRRGKTQVDYVTFASPEAVVAIKNYLEERNRIYKLNIGSPHDFVFVTYGAKEKSKGGTQIKNSTFCEIFSKLGDELGYGNGDYQVLTKSHALRKYFATTLQDAGMPKFYIDYMLGHQQSGNDLAYFKIDVKKVKQLYIKYLPYLTFEKTIEVRSLEAKDAQRLEEVSKENEQLKKRLSDFEKDKNELKEQYAIILTQFQQQQRLIEQLVNNVKVEHVGKMPLKYAGYILHEEKKKRKGKPSSQP